VSPAPLALRRDELRADTAVRAICVRLIWNRHFSIKSVLCLRRQPKDLSVAEDRSRSRTGDKGEPTCRSLACSRTAI
jgi:hypothetical protein